MIDTQENSYDNAAVLERICGLTDRGYAVYFGEIATGALVTEVETAAEYYALVLRGSVHEEQIYMTNHIRGAAHVISQARRDIYWAAEEPFEPIERFSEHVVLRDSLVRTDSTAAGALSKAIKALLQSEEPTLTSKKFNRPERLRQARNHCHR